MIGKVGGPKVGLVSSSCGKVSMNNTRREALVPVAFGENQIQQSEQADSADSLY